MQVLHFLDVPSIWHDPSVQLREYLDKLVHRFLNTAIL